MAATAPRGSTDADLGVKPMTARQRLDQRHGIEDERSFGTVVSDLVSHSQELLRGELAFAKREMTENAKQYGGAAAMGAAAWPFVLSAVVLLGLALGTGLSEWMPTWLGFLIAAVVYLAIAGGLALAAKSRVKDANLAPKMAIEETKEDLSWIKAHSA